MRLPNRVATVTGGASGIGRATARLFAAEGAKVVVADLNEQGGLETVDSIKSAGGQAVFCRTDVTPEQVKNMVALAAKEYGKLDTMCNFAGMVHPVGSAAEEVPPRRDRSMGLRMQSASNGPHPGVGGHPFRWRQVGAK